MTSRLKIAYRTRAQSMMGIDELARELDQDLDGILRRFGLPPGLMDQPETYIPYSAMCGVMETCSFEWACPDLGLRLAHSRHIDLLGPVGLAVRLAATVEEAWDKLADYIAIHSTGFHIYIEQYGPPTARQAALVFMPKPGGGAGRQVLEHSLYVCRNILAMLTGVHNFKPARASFQFSAPAEVATVRRYFDCPVSYNEPLHALHFDARLLQTPNVMYDNAYAPLIETYFDKLRPQLDVDIVQAVRNMIGNLISTGTCSLVGVANCYRIHPRTLQRRLQEKGVSFAEILDDYRKSLAMELVGRGSMPLVKIADALGYADQSTFNQAFRRWTATTPTMYADQHQSVGDW